jgi:SPP1 gp7 family putative phage head morphogenesis protein
MATEAASRFVLRTNAQQKQKFYAGMSRAVGVDFQTILAEPAGGTDVDTLLRASVRENVNLIKDVARSAIDDIEDWVWNATTDGKDAKTIIQNIASARRRPLPDGTVSLYRQNLNHAKFIARDQYAKLNGNLNRVRQSNLGVTEYIWVTVGDDRVRESHKAHNGKTFRWDSPPLNTGHPGQDYQCRCIAQPIIEI